MATRQQKNTLTEEGLILRKRAEEMVEFMEKTKAEITSSTENVNGDIYIGGGETEGFRIICLNFKINPETEMGNIRFKN